MEARWSGRSSRQTRLEAHHAVSQDEAPWYCATCASGGRRIFQVSRAEVVPELSSLNYNIGICMLKIQRSANGRVVFTLSGRIEVEDFKELQQLLALEKTGQDVVLDLRDVTLVNQDAVKFRRLRGRQHQARELSRLYPRVDRAGKKSNQAPTDSMKGSSRAASSLSATRRPPAAFRP